MAAPCRGVGQASSPQDDADGEDADEEMEVLANDSPAIISQTPSHLQPS